jgi:hypothetical protein
MLVLIAAPAIWARASSQAAEAEIVLRVKDSKRYAAETNRAVKTALFVVRPLMSGVEMTRRGVPLSVAYGSIVLSNMTIACDAYAERPTGTAQVKTADDFIVNVRFLDQYPRGQDWAFGVLGKLFVADAETGRAEFPNYVVAVQHTGPMGSQSDAAFNDMGTAQIMQYFGLATKTSLPIQPNAPPVVVERDGDQYHATLSARGDDVVVSGKVPLTVCPAM